MGGSAEDGASGAARTPGRRRSRRRLIQESRIRRTDDLSFWALEALVV
jgi:hypothetical protein